MSSRANFFWEYLFLNMSKPFTTVFWYWKWYNIIELNYIYLIYDTLCEIPWQHFDRDIVDTCTHRHFILQSKRDYTFCQTWKMNLAYKRRTQRATGVQKKRWETEIGFMVYQRRGSNRFVLSVWKEIENLCRDFMIFMGDARY